MAPNLIIPQTAGIDPTMSTDPKWRSCCGCCHVKTGAKVIAWIEIILSSISLLLGIVSLTYAPTPSMNAISLILLCIWIVVASLVLIGIRMINPWLLLPYVIAKIIQAFLVLLGLSMAIMVTMALNRHHATNGNATAEPEPEPEPESEPHNSTNPEPIPESEAATARKVLAMLPNYTANGAYIGIAAAILITLIQLALIVYFVYIVFRCYQYLKLVKLQPHGAHAAMTGATNYPVMGQQVHQFAVVQQPGGIAVPQGPLILSAPLPAINPGPGGVYGAGEPYTGPPQPAGLPQYGQLSQNNTNKKEY